MPPSSPTTKSTLYSPPSSPPLSPRSSRASRQYSPPSSPSLSRSSALSHRPSSVSPQKRPSAPCHATYPSISSTLSLLEERETEVDKRSAVYVTDSDSEPQFQPGCVPRPMGRGRSCSATVPRSGDLGGPLSISSSPGRKQRPPLPALLTSASSPQLRRLAELATTPSPSFSSLRSPLLPSPMSDMTLTPETEVVTPGEAITLSPENPVEEGAAEPGLASRWSLDSVASRPRINQMALDDASSSPASKTKKRDRLLSLISGRTRSGSVTKPQPPPNTPRGSTDVLDIRYIDSRDTPSPSSRSSSRPSFTMPPKISMAPSLASSDSSTASTASTLATPIESAHPTLSDPFHLDGPSCMQEQVEEEEEEDNLVFADNPYLEPDYPYHHAFPSTSLPHPPPHDLPQAYHESLKLQIPDRPMSPAEPPPQPTLPLPSPSTPSPSFLVPSPRPQSFFASITGRQRRRKKKLVISGAPLELNLSRSSSSVSNAQSSDDYHHRQAEQQRRVQNVVKWCESFGPVRKIETKEDGSLHVYWKDWEVADMVRVSCLGQLNVSALMFVLLRVGVPHSGAGSHQGCRPCQPRMVLYLMRSQRAPSRPSMHTAPRATDHRNLHYYPPRSHPPYPLFAIIQSSRSPSATSYAHFRLIYSIHSTSTLLASVHIIIAHPIVAQYGINYLAHAHTHTH